MVRPMDDMFKIACLETVWFLFEWIHRKQRVPFLLTWINFNPNMDK